MEYKFRYRFVDEKLKNELKEYEKDMQIILMGINELYDTFNTMLEITRRMTHGNSSESVDDALIKKWLRQTLHEKYPFRHVFKILTTGYEEDPTITKSFDNAYVFFKEVEGICKKYDCDINIDLFIEYYLYVHKTNFWENMPGKRLANVFGTDNHKCQTHFVEIIDNKINTRIISMFVWKLRDKVSQNHDYMHKDPIFIFKMLNKLTIGLPYSPLLLHRFAGGLFDRKSIIFDLVDSMKLIFKNKDIPLHRILNGYDDANVNNFIYMEACFNTKRLNINSHRIEIGDLKKIDNMYTIKNTIAIDNENKKICRTSGSIVMTDNILSMTKHFIMNKTGGYIRYVHK